MQLGAERMNLNNSKNMGQLLRDFLQVLTKKNQNTRRVYQDLRLSTYSTPRPPKVFSLKQKTNEILPAAMEKKNCILKKTVSCSQSFRLCLQSPVDVQISNHLLKQERDCKKNGKMRISKIKVIQAGLGIFTHIPVYSCIFRHIQT